MIRPRTLVACSAVALSGVVLLGAEKPPEDYVKAMKDLANFATTMTRPDAELDLVKTKEFVPLVRDAFGVVQRYWLDHNATGAHHAEITTAQEAIKAASDMGVAANLQSPEGIAASVKDIVGRCQPFHVAHREKGPDGAFLIKLD
jgi:hypothetical protein